MQVSGLTFEEPFPLSTHPKYGTSYATLSKTDGPGVAGSHRQSNSTSRQLLDRSGNAWHRRQFQAAIDRVLSSRRVDLIHMHGLDFSEYTVPASIPLLVTLHMPIAWYPLDTWARFATRAHFCCVSESQRRSAPPALRHYTVVENGVALPPPPASVPPGNSALVMGRICPEKNAAAALKAGTLAGMPVLLAGQTYPYREHIQYLHDTIEPLLRNSHDGIQHKLLGPLGPAQRHNRLAQAKCLLHPTLAPETSSLVAMEALAAGTPVIAYPSGALPEIVEDGVTGFLVDSVPAMAEAIRNVDRIAPAACRHVAEQRFDRARMIQSYFELYESLVSRHRIERRYA